ncbi:MAG: helix-hairpin-helix domain-containing protein [Candidatus Thermoplasmatota archaeon]|nr:helix-hairpin-helix domain-containing protein [Candidatus Thermoplasmatota archaeon]
MARKIDKIYSGGKLVKIVISGEEVVEKPAETAKVEVGVEAGPEKEKVIEIFIKIPTITKKKALALYDAGIKSLRELALAPTEKLLAIKEITIKDVKAIKSGLKGIYEEPAPSPGLKIAGKKILTGAKAVGGKIVSVSKKGLSYAKKGAAATKAKLKSAYKKLTAPEEEVKAVKVRKKRRKGKAKLHRRRTRTK